MLQDRFCFIEKQECIFARSVCKDIRTHSKCVHTKQIVSLIPHADKTEPQTRSFLWGLRGTLFHLEVRKAQGVLGIISYNCTISVIWAVIHYNYSLSVLITVYSIRHKSMKLPIVVTWKQVKTRCDTLMYSPTVSMLVWSTMKSTMRILQQWTVWL